MKHCIIMTVYQDLPMINKFIETVPTDWGIYVHIDAKSEIKVSDISSRAKVFKIKKIYWGAWEHLWVFVHLLKEAYADNKYDYYHLVSGQDYFAINPCDFDKVLGQDGKNYIGVFPVPNDWWGWEGGLKIFKYRTLSSYADIRNSVPRALNKLLYLFQKILGLTKPLPLMQLYGGSVYSSLHHNFVGWLLKSKDANELLESLRFTTCAEEVFIPTLIMNSPYRQDCVNSNLRYDDWSTKPAPKFLDEEDFDKVINSSCLFCRKVTSQKSAKLLKMLEERYQA